MRTLSARAVDREVERAEAVLSRHALPWGITSYQLEPDQDQDGDPVMWVWLDQNEDSTRWDPAHRAELAAFVETLRQELYDIFEDYRPHFRMRVASNAPRAPRRP